MNLSSGQGVAGAFRVAVLLLAVAILPMPAAAAETRRDRQGPAFSVTELVHDFGTVAQGQLLQHEFRVTNTGREVLEIRDLRPACGCTTATDWPRRLEPGACGVIQVTLDTAQFLGPIAKTIEVLTNDPTRPASTLELKATIWTPVTVAHRILLFQAVSDPNQGGTRSTTLRNELTVPLTLTTPESDNPHFRPELREVVAGKEYELKVTTVPPLPDGTQTGRITMKSSHPQMPTISVQAIVTTLPAIQVAPTQITLSASKLAAPERRFAVLMKHRGSSLEVSELTTDAPGVELATAFTADRGQFTVTLTFPAGFEIPRGHRFFLRGKTNHPTLPRFEIPIVANAGS